MGSTSASTRAVQLAGFHPPMAPMLQNRVLNRRSSESPMRCFKVSVTCWSSPMG